MVTLIPVSKVNSGEGMHTITSHPNQLQWYKQFTRNTGIPIKCCTNHVRLLLIGDAKHLVVTQISLAVIKTLHSLIAQSIQ